jgi:CMP-N-acetylneuraminic acid synthetase
MSLRHIAIIPARKGSKGLPGKNRMFFDNTAGFLSQLNWLDETVVSTDDEEIAKMAASRNYTVHDRRPELANDEASIRSVFVSIADDLNLGANDRMWLFYLPVLFKDRHDFDMAYRVVCEQNCHNLCGFIEMDTGSHPYYTWRHDLENKTMLQFVPNDVARRQDLPKAYTHHHYVFCISPTALPMVNNEMIGPKTEPYFIPKSTCEKLVEVDTPEQMDKWQSIKKDIIS